MSAALVGRDRAATVLGELAHARLETGVHLWTARVLIAAKGGGIARTVPLKLFIAVLRRYRGDGRNDKGQQWGRHDKRLEQGSPPVLSGIRTGRCSMSFRGRLPCGSSRLGPRGYYEPVVSWAACLSMM